MEPSLTTTPKDRPIRILGLDPALNTGWTVVEIKGEAQEIAEIKSYGSFTVDNSTGYEGDAIIYMQNRVRELIIDNEITNVVFEEFFFSKRFANGSCMNAYLRAAIMSATRELDLPYALINVSDWKKHIAGRIKPTREDIQKWGKAQAKKFFVQEALYRKYGIRFPNHAISQKTKKPIIFKSDAVDAVAIAVYWCQKELGCERVFATFEIPEDVVFKKKSDKIFIYE